MITSRGYRILRRTARVVHTLELIYTVGPPFLIGLVLAAWFSGALR